MGQTDTATKKVNPLLSHMRQPKVYIKLPSEGKYYKDGGLNPSVNGEYPVYSMTAKDELIIKTPDALLNGQGIVDVIESCMPNIKNAWSVPNTDIDVIMIAIRIATYGHKMTINVQHEDLDDGNQDFEIDLREILDQLQTDIRWEDRVEIRPNLVLYVKPFDYETVNKNAMTEFESQRIMNIVNDSNLTEEQKLAAFKESFTKLTNLTIQLIAKSVYKVDSDIGTTDDPEEIMEFMLNSDKEINDAVKNHLDSLKGYNTVKPIKINVSKDPENPKVIEVPIIFDYSSFFE